LSFLCGYCCFIFFLHHLRAELHGALPGVEQVQGVAAVAASVVDAAAA